jgi:hypothetical protein
MTTGVFVAKGVYHIAKTKDLAVWVPAFAGTTQERGAALEG